MFLFNFENYAYSMSVSVMYMYNTLLSYQGYQGKKAFIIAQSPMENTVRDFWKMMVDYKVSTIVMLCGDEVLHN